ncbi:ATP-binding protein [Ornithinimicrobium panacihumi]|uniref:ATP-binding protein n=1 Tax=Ornithinimicrobium panacihumi TaxID=2008449 RepID=UPI003F8A8041
MSQVEPFAGARSLDGRAAADGSPTPAPASSYAVVVGTGELAGLAVDELTGVTSGVHRVDRPEDLVGWAPPTDRWVAVLVLIDRDDGVGIDGVVKTLLGLPALGDARLLVVTTRTSLTDMSRSVDAGFVDGVVAAPWTPGNLSRYAEAQVSRAALLAGRPAPWERSDSELLRRLVMGTDAAAEELLAAIETVLGPRPRVHLDKGVRITVPEERLNQVFLVLKGRVVLTVTSPAGEVVLHHASTGPLVGLVALTEMQHSTVTARTTSRCEMVSLTLEQLDYALTRNPDVGTALTALTMRALTTRLRRSEQLHIKNATLTAELRATLEELRAARVELVEQARMATLGELAAGIAHELNNPAATVTRGVDHLSSDLRALLGGPPPAPAREQARERASAVRGAVGLVRALLPGRVRNAVVTREAGAVRDARAVGAGETHELPRRHAGHDPVLDALVSAEERDHVSAGQERALRRALAGVVDDPAMVRRLVAAGVHDPEQARALVEGSPDLLARVEKAAGIGAALRSVRVAGHHIATLVSALHTHARPDPDGDQELHEPTDVAATVQDALRLLEHRLRDVRVEVEVEQGLSPVVSGPGLLTQVWTNLLSNAAEAITRARTTAEGEGSGNGAGAAARASASAGDGAAASANAGDGAGPGVITVRVYARPAQTPPTDRSTDLSATSTGQFVVPTADLGTSDMAAPEVVTVEVEDDGPGVPAPLQEQVFTPRFTTKHGVVRYGLGLGLGIARSIVGRHGGRMTLDSRPGRTVFTVDLPAAGAPHLTPTLGGDPRSDGSPTPESSPGPDGTRPTARGEASEGGAPPHTPKEEA